MDLTRIPVWELALMAAAGVAVVIVFMLWWFLGYDLAVVAKAGASMQAGLASILV